MTREELIKRVALKMDEISSSDDVMVPVNAGDNNPLYTQINNLLNESVNDVLMKAPIYRLHSQTESLNLTTASDSLDTNEIFNDERLTAIITVPEDFLRVVSISDRAFQRPIVELAMEGDDTDKKQHIKHLVAKTAKPVAVISNGVNGRLITCYSYNTNTNPSITFRYIKRYDNDRDTTAETDLDAYMIDIVSWVCAGKVFAAQGDVTKEKICGENASALMI